MVEWVLILTLFSNTSQTGASVAMQPFNQKETSNALHV
jgi:hypothetical protein